MEEYKQNSGRDDKMSLIDETKTCRKLMNELKAPWKDTKTLSKILAEDEDDTIHQRIVDLIAIISTMLPEVETIHTKLEESYATIENIKKDREKIQQQSNNMHVLRTVFKAPK